MIDHPTFKLHFIQTFFSKSFCCKRLLHLLFQGVLLLVLLPDKERI